MMKSVTGQLNQEQNSIQSGVRRPFHIGDELHCVARAVTTLSSDEITDVQARRLQRIGDHYRSQSIHECHSFISQVLVKLDGSVSPEHLSILFEGVPDSVLQNYIENKDVFAFDSGLNQVVQNYLNGEVTPLVLKNDAPSVWLKSFEIMRFPTSINLKKYPLQPLLTFDN